MKKLILTAALFTVAAPSVVASNMSLEEHLTQGALQIQQAKEKRGATIVTVGDQAGCDFRTGLTRIQDAIDSGADEIRIASSTYDENLVINDISVTLKGGYIDCANAENDISTDSRQVIQGVAAANLPVIQIEGNTQRNTVNLERLQLQNGTSVGFFTSGGVSTLSADLALNLNNITLTANEGVAGGGLSMFLGDTDVVMVDTWVINNTADSGGGVYCAGADNSLLILDSNGSGVSGITTNTATAGNGGGMLLASGCRLTTFSGSQDGGFDFRGFRANSATGDGGALQVESGAVATLFGSQSCLGFFCFGNNTTPLNVNNNSADGDGGGINVTGAASALNLTNALIEDNTAANGGGINLQDEATLTMRSVFVNNTCWSPGSCSQIVGNEATGSRAGGLYLQTGSSADVANTLFANNRSDFGTAIYAASDDGGVRSGLNLEGSLLVFNGDNGADGFVDRNVIRSNRADVTIEFSTIADNNLTTTSDGASLDTRITGTMTLNSSIVHDPGQLVYNEGTVDGTPLNGDCVIVNEDATIPSVTEAVVDDPEFINRAGGDFHLDATVSPALDFCDTFFTSPDFNDSDNDVRGFDDPGATNNLGPYDVGYDETYDNDIIFKDGFE